MSKRFALRFKTFLALVAITSFGGPLYGALFGLPVELTFYGPMVSSMIGGSAIWGFEILFVPSRYGEFIRRLPFFLSVGLRIALVALLVTVNGPVTLYVMSGEFDPLASLSLGPSIYLFVSGVVFVIFSLLQIVRIVGARVMANILIGRYRRPVREDRVFLFLDIKGSMSLSEKLGDIGVQNLISQFFFDITEPILEWGGEVHRYIGDEVVITWFLKDGIKNAACLRCCFAIQRKIRERAARYREKFGAVPEFRIGLHAGRVVAAQCGDVKKEIVFFGDTINTTARIEQYCKEADQALLISGELRAQLPASDDWQAVSIGNIQLRGRQAEMELFSVSEGA